MLGIEKALQISDVRYMALPIMIIAHLYDNYYNNIFYHCVNDILTLVELNPLNR